MARLAGRLEIARGAVAHALSRREGAASGVGRVLVAHRLLLGDTLMLSPLLKKLRQAHPGARIAMTMAPAFLPLYASRPWGVDALAFEPHDAASVRRIVQGGPYDLAVIPGDNRHSWLAYAAGSARIVAHAGDRPAWKSWPVNQLQPYASAPRTWGEMTADLIPGADPEPFDAAEWPAPPCAPFERPSAPYAVLHVGASNPLRTWFAPRWQELAQRLANQGLTVVWSAGRSEAALVAAADPQQRFRSYAGELDLAQLFHLLQGARLLVSPETGVAHLARITATPSVILYGQGSDQLFGAGRFWGAVPQHALIEADFPCRNQHHLFRRELDWVQRCDRRPPACTHAACMEPLGVNRVLQAARVLGALP